jgi:hypothetical protein
MTLNKTEEQNLKCAMMTSSAECYFAECLYVESRGAKLTTTIIPFSFQLSKFSTFYVKISFAPLMSIYLSLFSLSL